MLIIKLLKFEGPVALWVRPPFASSVYDSICLCWTHWTSQVGPLFFGKPLCWDVLVLGVSVRGSPHRDSSKAARMQEKEA